MPLKVVHALDTKKPAAGITHFLRVLNLPQLRRPITEEVSHEHLSMRAPSCNSLSVAANKRWHTCGSTVETHLLAAIVVQVLGTVKNALVVWMGILFLADVVTPLQVGPQY